MSSDEMYVTKRSGAVETVSFDKILHRIKTIGQEAGVKINYTSLVMKIIDQLYDKISTTKIDELTAEQCASMSSTHYDYGTIASHIVVSNHHKNTPTDFFKVIRTLYESLDKNGVQSPIVSKELYDIAEKNFEIINGALDFRRDYLIDFFGFKTLERSYLMRSNGVIVERPQHMWMRVAIGIHGADIDAAIETYHLMSQKYFTHATPTLFNAGTPRPQLSSCFLIAMENDSIEGIYNTLKDCALISKWAGGIGMHIHNVRATGSQIRGTNGTSNGIVPMLRVFNNTAKYVDQCITPETYIYTTQGPIEIQNCSYGETQVFNLTGGVETIENVLEHPYEGQIYSIETMHSIDNLRITPEHPVYALVGQVRGINYSVIENRLNKNISKFEWVDAKDLQNDDMLIYKIPSHSTDIDEITNDDCYMYGVLLGDGCLSNADQNGYISLHTTNKKHILDFAIQYFENKCVQYRINTNENVTRINWNKSINMPFRYSDVYDSNKTKRAHHKWLNLPIEKSKYVLKGLIDTDGCKHLELSFDSTSRNLIESVRFLCLKLGVLTSGYIRDRVGESHISSAGNLIINQKISYCLKIPQTQAICDLINTDYDDSQFFKFFRYNDFLLTRIKNITVEDYSGTLYDLQMKTQHDYMIHNCIVHNGGGRRNGSFAIYLEPWHADIEMFLEMRKNHGDEELKARDLFYALWIPDLFMERVKTDGTWTLMCPNECPGLADVYGPAFVELYTKYEQAGRGRTTVKARELWFKVLDAQMETGTPYLCYKDAANRKSNQQNVGVIKSSNLCVAPETIILTDKGHVEIQSLENKKVNVWNGQEYSEVEVKKTGENQKLIEVHTDDESMLTCTPYHKFYIQAKYTRSKIIQTEAQNLKPGDKIIKCEYPIIDGTNNMLYPYTHGFFCGDGTYGKIKDHPPIKCEFKSIDGHSFCKRHLLYETENNKTKTYEDNVYCNEISYEKKPKIFLYGEKKELLEHFTYRTVSENIDRMTLELPMDIEEKFFVPMNNTLKDKMEWFSGYCDADGSIANNGTNQQLQVGSISKDFLIKVRLMLHTCGINPKVRKNKEIGTSLLPDGRGGNRLFETQELYRLLITSTDLRILVEAGFSPNRLKINTENIIQRAASHFIKIKEIIDNNRIDDTFCFTEPKRNMGVFNGIITGQCSEIMEYSDENETAVCNLASIALPTFVEKGVFNYTKLEEVAGVITRNLNRVIDINYYPTEKTRTSNMRHRPIGIGVQGLADVFLIMNIAYHSEAACELNRLIFETIYYGAVKASADLATHLGPYPSFAGSPASKGQLQFDLWNVKPTPDRYDWITLKTQIQKTGMRNSLLLAPMPTASTSQILGFNECFEPFTSNIYSRRTLAGEFILTNKYLMRELIELGLWNAELKNNIIANQGSIQHIAEIPADMKLRYKTVWEIPMRHVIDMAADRGAYICQSQSLNLWIEDPTYNSLTSMHFYSWSKGLKTGIYYLRRRGKHRAQQFTIEPKTGECELCSS
jgi:ribonucleoside-diphosphate reductase alpha chain